MVRRLAQILRPWLGWLPLGALLLLCALAAASIGAAHWVRLPDNQSALATVAVCAPLATWWLAGWRRPPVVARMRVASTLLVAVALALVGALLISLLLARWAPPPQLVLEWARSGDAAPVAAHMQAAVDRVIARATLWWLGVRAGGAQADEYLFSFLAAAVLWVVGCAAAALLRATRQGLVAALPPLLLLGTVVFLSGEGRPLFITGLAVALALHVAAENTRLASRWESLPLDYSRDLFLERWFAAAGLAAVALAVAALLPVVSIDSIANFYARLVEPVDERLEGVRRQAFPNLEVRPRFEIAGAATGLPNDFLLGSGPELSSEAILTVRTSDAGSLEEPAERPYLRALALERYTGHGWERGDEGRLLSLPANTRRTEVPEAGRRILAQSIRLQRPSRTWYSVPEPLEFSGNALLEYDAQGSLISAAGSPGAYTVVSAVPALSDDALAALPPWDEATPLPTGFDAYLALPETITDRTRRLAADLTSGISSPYLQAQAIERYLRSFPYDLDIPPPPEGVVDVADWFLFELQRGYCDYYATAFAVLARSAGLPTRFVTGYAPGSWQPYEQLWNVTAAQSHSWPELYLPAVGWVPFEPTAGRATLVRTGQASAPVSTPVAPLPPPPAPVEEPWNPEMLVWLLPLALLFWGVWRLWSGQRERRADPWQALQTWGARMGRPRSDDETPLEYGEALALLAEEWALQPRGDAGAARQLARTVSSESRALGAAAANALYAPPSARPTAADEAQAHWQRLRPLLAPLSRRRRRM
jgi:transglutaminase-like putative cysteine protease